MLHYALHIPLSLIYISTSRKYIVAKSSTEQPYKRAAPSTTRFCSLRIPLRGWANQEEHCEHCERTVQFSQLTCRDLVPRLSQLLFVRIFASSLCDFWVPIKVNIKRISPTIAPGNDPDFDRAHPAIILLNVLLHFGIERGDCGREKVLYNKFCIPTRRIEGRPVFFASLVRSIVQVQGSTTTSTTTATNVQLLTVDVILIKWTVLYS